MAWNEPGGGGRDPWGNGNGNSPPDLDAILKRLTEKVEGFFGGKSGGNSSGNGGQSSVLLYVGLVVVAVLWAVMGTYKIDTKEQVVVLRFGKFLEVKGEGLRWNPPLVDKVIKVDVTQARRHQIEKLNEMLTGDENIVELPLTVEYNVSDVKAFVLNVKDPETTLHDATDSALRHVVGSAKLNDVISTGRGELSIEVERRLQEYLDLYGTGINVVEVNIQGAQPPAAVKSAYDDVIKAREDHQRVINEAESYANGVVPEARGKAQRVTEEAEGYKEQVIAEADGEAQRFEALLIEYQRAPEVTRERLYLDTVQEMMTNTSKVMVDVEGGGNVMYLPLDKLAQSGSASASPGGRVGLKASELDEIVRRVSDVLSQQISSGQKREVR